MLVSRRRSKIGDARVTRPRIRRRFALRLARGGLAAFAAGSFLLGSRSALRRAATRAGGVRLLPAAARCARRVGDPRGPFFRHALVLQRLVLLLVLDVRPLLWHPILAW